MSIGRIQTGFVHRALSPIAVPPCPPAPRCAPEPCDPDGRMPFGDFLAARNRAAREAEADRPRLLGHLDRTPRIDPRPAPRPADAPRLGEVLPIAPRPTERPIVHRHVRTMEVLTGNIIDVVM